VQEKISQVITQASYTTSGGATAIGVLTVNEWAAICGVILATATFAVNWHYKRKHYHLIKQQIEMRDTRIK